MNEHCSISYKADQLNNLFGSGINNREITLCLYFFKVTILCVKTNSLKSHGLPVGSKFTV